jgi:hypothetical protein
VAPCDEDWEAHGQNSGQELPRQVLPEYEFDTDRSVLERGTVRSLTPENCICAQNPLQFGTNRNPLKVLSNMCNLLISGFSRRRPQRHPSAAPVYTIDQEEGRDETLLTV